MQRTLPLLATLGIATLCNAQLPCGTPDPSPEQRSLWHAAVQARGGDPDDITIPVVFHILHSGEAVGDGDNLSDEEVHDALDCINTAFAGDWSTGLDMHMRFCLAATAPDGSATTGVTRTNAAATWPAFANGVHPAITPPCPGALEGDTVMLHTGWPREQYLNIWVAPDLCNIGGVGYSPDMTRFGVFIHTTYMYCPPTNSLVHEVGHACGLSHTFNTNAGPCITETDCTFYGDQCCDTPWHREYDCGNTNPCEPGMPVEEWRNTRNNFMSYCAVFWSDRRFTPDQRDKMHATMHAYAPTVLQSTACGLPTAVHDVDRKHPIAIAVVDRTLRFTAPAPGRMRIVDAIGRTVFTGRNQQGVVTLPMGDHVPGAYVLVVQADGGPPMTQRFVLP